MLRVSTPSRAAVSRSMVEVDLQALLLLVGIDVGDVRAVALQRLGQLRAPVVQVGQVVALQGVLVLRVALAAADADVLHRLQEQIGARHLGQLGAQAGDHLVGRDVALGQGLQRGEDEARVGLAAAGEADHGVDRRIAAHDDDELAELRAHRLERDALVGADAADDAAGVLLREEALGDRDVEVDVEDDRRQEHQHGRAADGAAPSRGVRP